MNLQHQVNGSVMENLAQNAGCESIPMGHGVAMITLNALAALLGTVGNLLVCGSVFMTHSLRTVPNLILVSLAVADLFVAVLAEPLFVAFLAEASRGSSCPHTVELLFRLIANACCGASVLHLCIISLERVIVVLKPHNFQQIITKKRLATVLALAWLFPVIYAILRLTINRSFTSYFTVAVLALNVVIIVICYALIMRKVRKQQHLQRTRSRNRKSRDRLERRVTMTIAIVIIFFLVSWVPILFLRSFKAANNDGLAYNWARTLSLMNSAMNPWIYCFRMRDFRAAYKRLFINCHWKIVEGRNRSYADGSEDRSQSNNRHKNSLRRPANAVEL